MKAAVSFSRRERFPSSGRFVYSIRRNWSLYLLITPVLIYFAVFIFWPMYGVIIAFKDFRPNLGILGSEWVGFKHFEKFFTSLHFGRTLRNTLTLSIYSLAVNFPLPIILAIMMNDLGSRLLQTGGSDPYLSSAFYFHGGSMRYDNAFLSQRYWPDQSANQAIGRREYKFSQYAVLL